MSDPSQHTPDHDAWDAGGHCNALVMVGDDADICGYVQPFPEPEPLTLLDRRIAAVEEALEPRVLEELSFGTGTTAQAVVAELIDRDLFERDESHTMAELYRQRMLYNAAAAGLWHLDGVFVTKSKRHHDGEECFGGGWFIVTVQLPTGRAPAPGRTRPAVDSQISNHYHLEDWDLFRVPEVVRAPEWDGHDAAEAERRLRTYLEGGAL